MSNHLPSVYSQFIYVSRYARYLDHEKRREVWPETIERYFNFYTDYIKEHCDFDLTKDRKELEEAVLNLDLVPSMRGLMTAGPALKRDSLAQYNCLRGDTLVTTLEYGIIPISKVEGKSVHVVDGNGEWTLSECKGYGIQDVYDVNFITSGRGKFSIGATANHRWILKDGSEVTTETLSVKDRIVNVSMPSPYESDTSSEDYLRGVQHGIVYGDGTAIYKHSRGTGLRNIYQENVCGGFVIRLCGTSRELLKYFEGYPVSYPDSYGGDPIVYIKDRAVDLKSLPVEGFFNEDYIGGFIHGWFAADGSVGSTVSLATTGVGCEWIMKHGVRHGFVVRNSDYTYPETTNYGKRSQPLYRVEFDRRWVEEKYILISYKKKNFVKVDIDKHPGFGKIESVTYSGKDNVYCFDVPTTHSFLLTKNILTRNCSFLPIDSIKSFDETLYILMCGVGVGFSVETSEVNNLPTIADELHETDTTIVVEDSRLGWAKALRELISLLYGGQIPKWDTSKLRPAGARLKTFGGRSSGPLPLIDLFKFTVAIFKRCAGRKLTSLECHDLVCKIADTVIVGGVRRSALISLSDLSDERMKEAKTGAWWHSHPYRRLSNNSAVYESKPDPGIFMREWLSLYESKSGERGIFSRHAAKKVIQNSNAFRKKLLGEGARIREYHPKISCNPCVPYETRILTDKGYFPIGDLVGNEVKIWNGKKWKNVIPKQTGESVINRVILSDGTHLECTPYHNWCIDGEDDFIQTKDLKEGDRLNKYEMPLVEGYGEYQHDAYSQGFYAADGCAGQNSSYVYHPKYPVINRLIGRISEKETFGRRRWTHGQMFDKAFVPLNGSIRYRLNWLAGLLDGDGTKVFSDSTKTSYSLQIASINEQFLKDIRLMLTTLGVQAKVGFMHKEPRKWGDYTCQRCFRICISTSDVQRLIKLGLCCEKIELNYFETDRDARRFVTVVSVESLGDEVVPVYCFNEEENHTGTFEGIVTGQCSEILLRPYETCNLTEVIVTSKDTLETLLEKVRKATILGTIQSALDDFKYVNKAWKRNVQDERLLGVSLTGIYDNELLNGKLGMDALKDALTHMKTVAIKTNMEWADKFGIAHSTAITCVKPSGTTSALCGTSSGIHPAHNPYYIRYVRNDMKDPLTEFMIDAGFPYEKDAYDPNNMVCFKFPMKAAEKAICRKDLSAIEHLQLWRVYQIYWCEHKPSITVSIKENEWVRVGGWVYDNFDWVSGVAFLPSDEDNHVYQQAPFTDCNESDYQKLVNEMPTDVDWTKLTAYEKEDCTVAIQQLACTGAEGCFL